MDLSGRQDDIDMLKAAVAALEARLAALEAAGGMAAAAPPPAPPADAAQGGLALAKVRLVKGIRLELASGSSSASLVQDFVEAYVHVGPSSSSSSSSSYLSAVMRFVPEEV